MLQLEIKPYQLDFKFQAFTSRGEIKKRKTWFIRISDSSGNKGIGEVAPIERLSPENIEDIDDELLKLGEKLNNTSLPENETEVLEIASKLVSDDFPSIKFGLETALLDLVNRGSKTFFENASNDIVIPINGLIWMGDKEFMKKQIAEKLDQGYSCIKLKVGSLDFDTELSIISSLRKISEDLIIRLDANGAFQTNEVLLKLKALKKFKIHSIEQPILPKQPEAMEMVCLKSEIPIALDEELIGVCTEKERIALIHDLKPHYLVLKPSLLGGFISVNNWIDLANRYSIGWWATSYLESNIGLNAIAQLVARHSINEHAGLGTGGLYHNNISSPISIKNGYLSYDLDRAWVEIVF